MKTTLPGTGPFGPLAPSRLALMGLRFADGEGGANPASTNPEPVAPPAQPTPTPTPPPGSTPPAPAPTPTPTPTPPPGRSETPPPAADGDGENEDELPAWARKSLTSARNEAKNLRTRLGEATTKSQQEKEDLVKSVAKTLGLVEDDAKDPAELLEAARLETEQQRAKAKQATIELALYRAALAPDINADADALLDSRTFNDKIATLDPTADDFSARVTELIKAQVEAQPTKFKRTPVVTQSSDGKPMNGQPTPAADDIESFRKKYRESRGVVA